MLTARISRITRHRSIERSLRHFAHRLREADMRLATVRKYIRDVRAFLRYCQHARVTNEVCAGWREELITRGYAPASVNSMVAAANRFFVEMGWRDVHIHALKIQRRPYADEGEELTAEEYRALLAAAEGDRRLYYVLETIACTGMRVSELQFVTARAVAAGRVRIRNKGKIREILFPARLARELAAYAEERGIRGERAVFSTAGGLPLDRSYIWAAMKRLCAAAKVDPAKVYPHNLRKLFARSYYKASGDIVKLADLLGHSSINTTRIYLVSSGKEHQKYLDKLELLCTKMTNNLHV